MKTTLFLSALLLLIVTNSFSQKEIKNTKIKGLLCLTPYTETEFFTLTDDSGAYKLYRTDLQFNNVLIKKFKTEDFPVFKKAGFYINYYRDGKYYIKVGSDDKVESNKFNRGLLSIDVKTGAIEVHQAEMKNFSKNIDYFFMLKEDTSGFYIYSIQKSTTKVKNLEIQLLDKQMQTYEVLNIPYYDEKGNETNSFYVDRNDNVFTLCYGNDNKVILRKYAKGKQSPDEISITIPGDKVSDADVLFKIIDSNKAILGTFSSSHVTFNSVDFETKNITHSFQKEITEEFINKLYLKKIISASYDKDKVPNNLKSFLLESADLTSTGELIITLQEYKEKSYGHPNYFRNSNNPQLAPTRTSNEMCYLYDIITICLNPTLEYKWGGRISRQAWDPHSDKIMFKQFITTDYLYYLTPEVKLIENNKGLMQLYKIDIKTGQYVKQLSILPGCKDKITNQDYNFMLGNKYMILLTSPGGFNFTTTTRLVDLSGN